MRTLVTGASGFIGGHFCRLAVLTGMDCRAAIRRLGSGPDNMETVVVPGAAMEHWGAALRGVDAVVHFAGLTGAGDSDMEAELEAVNVTFPARLARAAREAGAKRFVFLSSARVHGETSLGPGCRESDPPAPVDPYAASKWRGERELAAVAAATGLELVVLRPPIVVGAGVKGNLLRMLRALARGTPLPFASIANIRSLLGVRNLCEAVRLTLAVPDAAGKTYLVADADELSTPTFCRLMASALGRPARLYPVPPPLLRAGGRLLRRGREARRLTGSFQISADRIRDELGWRPVIALEEEIESMAAQFRRDTGR